MQSSRYSRGLNPAGRAGLRTERRQPFQSPCAGRHGAAGAGDTDIGKSMHLYSFASPDVQKKSDKELTAIITDGKGAMPSYKDKLSDAQIKDLVGYIRKLAKK